MSRVVINATDLRNDFFNKIDEVARTKKPIYIRKDREVLVKLEATEDGNTDKKWAETKKWLDRTRGMWAGRTEEGIRGRFREADRKSTLKLRRRKW